MAKYRFRLETLRKVREAHRDQQRVSLAEAYRAEQIVADNRLEIAAEHDALRDIRRSAIEAQHVDINRLLEAQRYELLLKAQEQELGKQALLLSAESERRRQSLVESDREVRVLDLLEDKHHEAHRRDQQRAETKQLDEVATNQWRFGGSDQT